MYCPSILETEWHDVLGVSSPISGEHRFNFVLFNHLNLIITREYIHKREEHVGYGVTNQGIDVWQGKIIFRAGPI